MGWTDGAPYRSIVGRTITELVADGHPAPPRETTGAVRERFDRAIGHRGLDQFQEPEYAQPRDLVTENGPPLIRFRPLPPAEPERPFMGRPVGGLPGYEGYAQPERPTIWDVLVASGVRPEALGRTAAAQASAARYIADQMAKGEPLAQAIEDVTGTPHVGTGVRGGLEQAAGLVNRFTGGLSRAVGALPVEPLPTGLGGPGGAVVPEQERVREKGPVTQFAFQSLPYVAADVLTGGALTPVYVLQAAAATEPVARAYDEGQIDGRTALTEIALTVGPVALDPALRALGAAGVRLGAYARSDEGRALLARLNSERGGGPGEPPRGGMFPGESAEQARFTAEGEIVREPGLPGDRGEQGALLGSPQRSGEGLTTESAGPLFQQAPGAGGGPAAGMPGPQGSRFAEVPAGAAGGQPPGASGTPSQPGAPPASPAPRGRQGAGLLSLGEAPAAESRPAAGAEPPGGGPPPEAPSLPGMPEPEDVPKPPTISEVEARSKPLTPEQRARVQRPVERAVFVPDDFEAAAARIIKQTPADYLQKLQDVLQRVAGVRRVAGFLEPIAAAVSRANAGEPIALAIVKRDLYATVEKGRARVAVWGWLGAHAREFGLDGRGIARAVQPEAAADIARGAVGRLDDIIEHPEDYRLTPAQRDAIEELTQAQTAVLQRELEAGVDVREVQGAYAARVVTKAPKGSGGPGGGGGFSTRPGHAKLRAFPDVRSGIAAGFEYANPVDAIMHRLETGIDAIANRRTLEQIKVLGEKPSERVPQRVRDAYLAAKERYKRARTPENADALDEAKRALRQAATRANQPRLGEAQAFGRIFPEAVVRELGNYTKIDDPGALEQFFAIQRASATSSDLSAAFVQNGNLFWRNNVAWWKSLGYGVMALARDPVGYVAHNVDAMMEGTRYGAILPPSEFILTESGPLPSRVARGEVGPQVTRPLTRAATLPVRATQRAFEWTVMVGQTELWKGASRMARTDAERAELAAVVRKQTGSMLRPGLTKGQRRAEVTTFFAGRFLMAVNATAADALRGGLRGAEARKTLGMLFGGATALTIAGQLATDGTMPNLTDPSSRDKPWLSIKRPGGTINLYGPLYPYLKAYASIGEDLAQGKPLAAGDEALFLARGHASLPVSAVVDFITGEDVVGRPVEQSVGGALRYFGERFIPISARGLTALREFPEGVGQALGLRANPSSAFRRKVDAADKAIGRHGGDFRAAYQDAVKAGDAGLEDGIRIRWREDFERRAGAAGLTVIPGTQDPPRAPRIEVTAWTQRWPEYGGYIAQQLDLPPAGSLAALRAAWLEKWLPRYRQDFPDIGEKQARADVAALFDDQPVVKSYAKAEQRFRLEYWRQHADLLDEAQALGLEELNDAERRILSGAGSR